MGMYDGPDYYDESWQYHDGERDRAELAPAGQPITHEDLIRLDAVYRRMVLELDQRDRQMRQTLRLYRRALYLLLGVTVFVLIWAGLMLALFTW